MSHHYSASQFRDAFKPTRLLNYNPFNNTPCDPYGVHAQCLPPRCCPTQYIADDRGHLFPWIKRGCSSPWGDFAYPIWEQPPKECCDCVMQLRHPDKFRVPPEIYIAREEWNAAQESERIAKQIAKEGVCESPFLVPGMPCCPSNPCGDGCCDQLRMKVMICGDNPIERRRLFRELRRQQMAYRRAVCGTRGRMKGRVPFTPGTLNCQTWDNCKGARDPRRVWGKVLACTKSCCM